MHTDLYLSNDINSNLNKLLIKIKYFLKNKENFIQELPKLRNSLSKLDQNLFDLLLEHLFKCEAISPKSGEILISSIDDSDMSYTNMIFKKDHMIKLLQTYTSNHDIAESVISAFNLAGLKGKITIGKSNNEFIIVELLKGYTFEINPCISVGNIDIENPLLIPIDGYIESVSEIHHLLESLAVSKTAAILFVRGVSEDVKNTLKVNFDRKTVICVPVIVNYDLEGVNMLNDIAVISKCDVVSSTKGQLISSVELKSFNSVELISFSQNSTIILNKTSSSDVEKHVNFLKRKLLENNAPATLELISKRIQRLGSRHVSIKIPDDNSFKMKSFQLDRCIRAVKAASAHGVLLYEDNLYPSDSFKIANFYKIKFKEAIKDLGCIIT